MNKIQPITKARSIIPIICGLAMALVCFYMVNESLKVFFPPTRSDYSVSTPETQKITNQALTYIKNKDQNLKEKGYIGAIYFLIICGVGLIFFGGGTLFLIYRVWLFPPKKSNENG